jgi:hypothetical protein
VKYDREGLLAEKLLDLSDHLGALLIVRGIGVEEMESRSSELNICSEGGHPIHGAASIQVHAVDIAPLGSKSSGCRGTEAGRHTQDEYRSLRHG